MVLAARLDKLPIGHVGPRESQNNRAQQGKHLVLRRDPLYDDAGNVIETHEHAGER